MYNGIVEWVYRVQVCKLQSSRRNQVFHGKLWTFGRPTRQERQSLYHALSIEEREAASVDRRVGSKSTPLKLLFIQRP